MSKEVLSSAAVALAAAVSLPPLPPADLAASLAFGLFLETVPKLK